PDAATRRFAYDATRAGRILCCEYWLWNTSAIFQLDHLSGCVLEFHPEQRLQAAYLLREPGNAASIRHK
ncbi:hypothetical protein AAVH_41278, partial [Aphelenchoides avenae]